MIRKKRPAFHYDPETGRFTPVSPTSKDRLRTVGIVFGFFLATVAFSFLIYKTVLVPNRVESLQAQQNEILEAIQKQESMLAHYDQVLDKLYQKDNQLYSPLAETKGISKGNWNFGRGGIERYDTEKADLASYVEIHLENLDHKINLLSDNLEKARALAEIKGEKNKNLPAIRPVISGNMISGFGYRRHPIRGTMALHSGLDFACQNGTPVYATGDAIVEFSGRKESGYGIYIDLNHGDGLITKYGHLSKTSVETGAKVRRGDLIGYSGSTGASTGPHLHYEVIRDGEKIDPIDWFYEDISAKELAKLKLDGPSMD